MEGHNIKIEYIMGKGLPGENHNDHAKYVLRLIIEKLIKDPAFDDLTETAIRDVLITMLKDWNYYNKKDSRQERIEAFHAGYKSNKQNPALECQHRRTQQIKIIQPPFTKIICLDCEKEL